jgi:hypothetical protein
VDNFWKWVGEQTGNIIGVAGLITGFIFYWLSLRPKRFGWQVMSQTPILSAKSGHLPLKVVYDGKDVSSPIISQVKLGNTGKIELKSDDFDGPVKISFVKSDILQVLISGRSSDDINPAISEHTSKSISFTPSLLNPGEWIEYQLITDGALEVPTVRARVAGQGASAIHDRAEFTTRRQIAGVSTLFGGMILAVVLILVVQGEAKSWVPAVGWAIAIIGMVMLNRAEASAWKKLPKKKKTKRPKK